MSLKILGMVVVFISCTYMGKLLADRYTKRYAQLTIFLNFVEFFETEICYTCTPVIEIFSSLIPKINEPFKEIIMAVLDQLTSYGYRPLCDIWKENLYENKKNLALNQEDLDLLVYFGNTLGTTDKENQKKYFTVIKSRLSTQLNESQGNRKKYTKLFNELGIIAGLFIIILII